ncbi:MAG: hypothetical protein LBS75_00130 [Synergistaceae bacterium]|nr:hypothetical protein [Synergistaceae bacterium]
MSRLPDIVVERLSFNRTISGREWRVTAEGAEREAGMIRARLVEVNVREGGKEGVSTLRANFGEFSEADSKVWLREVSGMIAHEGRSVDVAAPSVAYDSSKDTWFFSDGVTLSSDAAALAGGAAKINADGVFTIGKGARASWNIK